MKLFLKSNNVVQIVLLGASLCMVRPALAGIDLDRTRVVFDGEANAASLHIKNSDKKDPYLAQSWLEDEHGHKGIDLPLVVVPPIQRIEPGKSSQIRIQALPTVNKLPQDRESIFYLVMQEVPPKISGTNTLQIAVQSRIKVMYRPQTVAKNAANVEAKWQNKVSLQKKGSKLTINNPTSYYLTVLDIATKTGGKPIEGFKPVMVAPYGEKTLSLNSNKLGMHPVINYINDFGGVKPIHLDCAGGLCTSHGRNKEEG